MEVARLLGRVKEIARRRLRCPMLCTAVASLPDARRGGGCVRGCGKFLRWSRPSRKNFGRGNLGGVRTLTPS